MAIRPEHLDQRAMVHAITGSLLQSAGNLSQAESEYVAALDCWTEAVRGKTADAAAVLTSLGTLYVEERRYADARRLLDQAFAVFVGSEDGSPMDHTKLLGVRGTMHARQRE
jgi:Flp pilus assembly protein TadD